MTQQTMFGQREMLTGKIRKWEAPNATGGELLLTCPRGPSSDEVYYQWDLTPYLTELVKRTERALLDPVELGHIYRAAVTHCEWMVDTSTNELLQRDAGVFMRWLRGALEHCRWATGREPLDSPDILPLA